MFSYETILDMKIKIKDIIKEDPALIRLIYNGKKLIDSKTLDESLIK